MRYYLHRDTPIHDWQVVTDQLDHGELIELPGVDWYSQARAEADRRNGTQDGGQEGLPL